MEIKRKYIVLFMLVMILINLASVALNYFKSQQIKRDFAQEMILVSRRVLEKNLERVKSAENVEETPESLPQADSPESRFTHTADLTSTKEKDLELAYHFFIDAGTRRISCGRDYFEEGDLIPSYGQISRIYDRWIVLQDGRTVKNSYLDQHNNNLEVTQNDTRTRDTFSQSF